MSKQLKPRNNYNFGDLHVGETRKFRVTETDPRAGTRALCAAYAYGRRNGQKFFGATTTTRFGNTYMTIGRSK